MIFSRNKKPKIICSLVILLAIALMPFTNVGVAPVQAVEEPRAASINPDFLEFWENPPETFYGYIPPPVDLSHLREIPVERAKELATLPNSFDWRTQGKVTSVKDQNPCGTCWVHGTLAAVESKVLIEESTTYDFSEQNLICCTDPAWVYLIGNRCSGGGWSWLAMDALSKKGTRLESCQPYNTDTIDTEACGDGCETIKRITDYRMVAWEATSPEVIDPIKNTIYNNGPVSMAYCHDDSHIYPGNIYYWPNCTQGTNHLVCIIGWNDTIAHPGGGGSGAWIVKNSWGTGWGDNGYFYLCYGSAGMDEVASYRYKDYDPNETIYYWDEAGWVGDGGYNDSSAWMANVFTSEQNGTLTNVKFWTTSNNAQYDLYVYNGSFGSQLAHQTGSCEECGYYSIPLSTLVPLTHGQQFTVAVKMTTPGYNYPIPFEKKWALGGETQSDPPLQSGVSFIRHGDTDAWTDAAEGSNPWNVCLRAVVSSGAPGQPDITVNPTSFEVTLAPGTTQAYTLNIGNVGGAALSYNISDRQTTGPSAPAGVEPPTPSASQIKKHLIQLNPSQPMSFPTPPTQGVEIYYDDGMADDAYICWDASNGFAVRFTPPVYPVDLAVARFFLYPEWPDFDHEVFGVWVFDDDGAGGAPGTLLGGGTTSASDWGWCDVDISSSGITITSGDFYIAYEQLTNYPDCEALGVDSDNPVGRSWDYWWGEWSPWDFENYMIRCVVEVEEGNNPPNTPSNPSPAHQATGVSVNANLSWIGGDPDAGDTVTYDVLFGTSPTPPLVSNDQIGTIYDPGTLSYNTKYYWKIVATDNHAAPTSGPVWYFTTGGTAEECSWLDENPTSGSVAAGNPDSITVTINTMGLAQGDYSAEVVIASNDPDENPKIVPVTLHVSSGNSAPNIPSDPLPPNHAPNVSIPVNLSWSGGDPDAGDTVTYDVYFGTGATPPLVSNDQSATTYDPGTLNNNTKYYWKMVATDNHSASTTGPLWDFTTGSQAGDDDNPDMATGLASLEGKLIMAYSYKFGDGIGGWTVYNPEWAVTHPEWNSLTTLHVGMGYWINVKDGCDLTYEANTYELDEGWNLIGWCGATAVGPPGAEDNPDVATGLDFIEDQLVMAYSYKAGEGIGGWTVYNPEWAVTHPEWNNLTTLYVSRGYWINVSGVCDLTYGANTYHLDEGWNLIGWVGW